MPEIKDEKRPELTPSLDPNIFKDFYWLKEELVKFCREQGLSTTGSKIEITRRIAAFLERGKVVEVNSARVHRPGPSKKLPIELSLETVITPDYKSDERHRKFFKSVIGPHFHFTTGFMQFFKVNTGKTYREAIEFWQSENSRSKQDKTAKSEIAPQFEYNRFMRDFRQDNPTKSFKEAVAAWKIIRQQPGNRIYKPGQIENDDS